VKSPLSLRSYKLVKQTCAATTPSGVANPKFGGAKIWGVKVYDFRPVFLNLLKTRTIFGSV